jgi:hypothetical protein
MFENFGLRPHYKVIFACALVWTLVFSASINVNAESTAATSEKMHARLEQLFTWRVSDRLRLNPEEEIKFNAEFKKLSIEKTNLTQELDRILEKIEKEKNNDKIISRLLSDYQTCLKKGNDLQIRELQVMKKIFGSRKFIEYILLKREMTQKFKDVLTQNSAQQSKSSANGAATSMKDPEVIQEK